jgi:2-dehydro-3-deoxy-D-arabinonate dehydratase
MKVFNTSHGIVIIDDENYYVVNADDWDSFINDDELYTKIREHIKQLQPDVSAARYVESHILPPIKSQEVWACGVTYYRSKVGRQEESKETGGSIFYSRVYEAERPEIFFKATAQRCVGHNQQVAIRKDSTWDVPEPELTLVVTSSGKIVGYTIGNDMSSRSIEGENPLYLPQAKMYDGSAAVGPCVYVTGEPLPPDTLIKLTITRQGKTVFEGEVEIKQIKRKFEELVSYVYRETSFPFGCLIMTGTGIVPSHDFSLQTNDIIEIEIQPIGVLKNTVK